MITYSEKLTTYDFHAYIDHQLNDDECDEIESRLDNEANVLQELQRCITINENIQEYFDNIVEESIPAEILALFSNSSTRPKIREPKINTAIRRDQSFLDEGTSDALDAIDALDKAQYNIDNQIETPPLHDDADTSIPVVDVTPDHNYSSVAEVEYEDDSLDEVYFEEDSHQQATDYPDLDYPEVETQSSSDSIDVENFLKGISEVDTIRDTPAVQRMPDSIRVGNLYQEKEHIVVTIFLALKEFIFVDLLRRNPPVIQHNVPRLGMDFDLDIDAAIEQTPKWQFWKNRMQNAADDAVDSMIEHIEPISPPTTSILANIKQFFVASHSPTGKVSPVAAAFDKKYWILSGLISGVLLTSLLGASESALGKKSLENLAISSHDFYANEAINMIEAGDQDFENHMTWLKEHWGKRVMAFDMMGSPFHRKGATLIPTLTDYSSLQIFENRNNERISLFVSRWDGDDNNVSCRIPNNIDGLCTWVSNSLLYIAVADLSLSRVRQFASLIATQS